MVMWWLLCFIYCLTASPTAHALEPSPTLLVTQHDVMTMVPQAFQYKLPFTGELTALHTTTLVANTTARVTQLPYREGDRIAKGAVVVRLDHTLLTASYAARQAEWLAAHQRWLLAHQQYVNMLSLYQQGFVSQMALDTAAMTDQVAQANEEVALQQQRQARHLLADATLHAPFAATLSQSFVTQHQMVMMGQNLVTLVDRTALEVRAEMAADNSEQVRVGQKGWAQVATGPPVALVVARIEPMLGTGTRALIVHLAFGHPLPSTWHVGMFVAGTIVVLEHQQALVVPYLAVHTEHSADFVYVINAATQVLEKRAVILGVRQADQVELSYGVQAGDRVIVSPLGVLPVGSVIQMQTVVPSDS